MITRMARAGPRCMLAEIVNLILCAVFGAATVLIFRPASYWGRMAVGAAMGLLLWLVKVTTIWWSYHGT